MRYQTRDVKSNERMSGQDAIRNVMKEEARNKHRSGSHFDL
jgi:hypothetical protein